MRPVLLLLVTLCLGSIACATAQTTPAGPLGQIDLKAKLPEGVSKGPEDPTAEHERSAEVCAGDRAPGVQVKVRWQTFTQGERSYIGSYAVEVTKPTEGVSVKLGEPAPMASASADPKAPYVASTTVVIKCKADGSELPNGAVPIRADGKVAK